MRLLKSFISIHCAQLLAKFYCWKSAFKLLTKIKLAHFTIIGSFRSCVNSLCKMQYIESFLTHCILHKQNSMQPSSAFLQPVWPALNWQTIFFEMWQIGARFEVNNEIISYSFLLSCSQCHYTILDSANGLSMIDNKEEKWRKRRATGKWKFWRIMML